MENPTAIIVRRYEGGFSNYLYLRVNQENEKRKAHTYL